MTRTKFLGLGPSEYELAEFKKDIDDSHNELGTFIIWYYKFNRPASKSNIFDEIENKIYYERIKINGFVITSPTRQQIEQVGPFIQADIIVDFAQYYVEQNNIKFTVNDFFIFEDIEYDIVLPWKQSRIGDHYGIIRLTGTKRKKRYQKTIEEDKQTISKMFGFIWNID